jgi:hypothetical protein
VSVESQRTWMPRIEKLAAGFGVTLETTSWGNHGKLNGPSGNTGMSLEQRKVWYTVEANLPQVLHEIMHIVTNPQGEDHEYVPEDFLLLQYERCVARTLGKFSYEQVVRWQLETVAPLIVPEAGLGEILNYEKTKPWLEGYDRARRLGLLNVRNEPTWALPTWTPELLEDARAKMEQARTGE